MKPHRTDALSLTFGLIFLATTLLWLLGRGREIAAEHVFGLVAFALIVLGILGLVGALRTNRDRPVPAPEDDAS